MKDDGLGSPAPERGRYSSRDLLLFVSPRDVLETGIPDWSPFYSIVTQKRNDQDGATLSLSPRQWSLLRASISKIHNLMLASTKGGLDG